MKLKDSQQYYHEVLKRIPPRPLPVFEDSGYAGTGLGKAMGSL